MEFGNVTRTLSHNLAETLAVFKPDFVYSYFINYVFL